ncbi:MAG: hypothetical protein RLO08_13875 [Parvibaculaceae bacterium]
MGELNDTDTPAPPTALLRRLAQSAYWRGCKRWGDVQPPVDLQHLVHLWVRQNGRCAVSGLPFSDERFEDALVKHPYRASLDRIDPWRPYLEGNMRLVCTAVNFGMGQWGDEVLRRIAEGMTAKRSTAEARTIWYAERHEEIDRLELELRTTPADAAAANRRRIAALKRAVTLGPEGLGKAARRAARRRRTAGIPPRRQIGRDRDHE